MKFRYYITDLFEGEVVGTEDRELAKSLSKSEDYFVLDSEKGVWFNNDGTPEGDEISIGDYTTEPRG
jgi:hypothetical protein